ncbi:UNVERIFIED_CONTAM: protein PTST, chloroplastic [Sesamum radiatum]|uniref:Protein PTST, chloroplastic n=1 Tax=Sesamum radiatum TaxID=300843 RepID=A0AAW2VQX7_SESRA
MECKMFSSAVQPCLARMDMKRIDRFQVKMDVFNGKRLNKLNRVLMENPVHYERWRVFCNPVSLEEEFSAIQSKNFSKDEDSGYEITVEEDLERPPTSEENVQVMGSFDGWSQGEHMSPEYNGSYATFSTTLMLIPGRYEIKFLVDGDWKLSPEFPTVGEGMLQNNLLVVE